MTSNRFQLVPFVLMVVAGCSPPSSAEFGPPKTFAKDQRPTEWDAPRNVRLRIQDMPPATPPAEQGAKVWTGDTPVGFESLPAVPAKFRDAVWRIAGEPNTDIYLTASVGGGTVGNLTRWYTEQFAIETVPTMEALPVVELAGRAGRLVELKGTFNRDKPGWAALIAFHAQGEQVMSLKFTGPEPVVMGNKDKFLALAKSLRSATASPDPKAPAIDPGQSMPANHPATGAPPTAGNKTPHAVAPTPFTATVPTGWTAKAGSAKPLHHTFGSDGEVYVSQLGGTLKGSLDIWRGELQQQPMAEADVAALPKVAFLGDDSVLLDLAGDFRSMTGKQIQGARMLVAARLDGGTITFVKLVGVAADVEAQVGAFRQFCGSVRRTP